MAFILNLRKCPWKIEYPECFVVNRLTPRDRVAMRVLSECFPVLMKVEKDKDWDEDARSLTARPGNSYKIETFMSDSKIETSSEYEDK